MNRLYGGYGPRNDPPGIDTAGRMFLHGEGKQGETVYRKRCSKKPACLDRGRYPTDPSQVVANPRIAAGSTVVSYRLRRFR
jgi:hypothetical protein